jgi:hypothetical protein
MGNILSQKPEEKRREIFKDLSLCGKTIRILGINCANMNWAHLAQK